MIGSITISLAPTRQATSSTRPTSAGKVTASVRTATRCGSAPAAWSRRGSVLVTLSSAMSSSTPPRTEGEPSGMSRPVETLAAMSRSKAVLFVAGSPSMIVISPSGMRPRHRYSTGCGSTSDMRRKTWPLRSAARTAAGIATPAGRLPSVAGA